MTISSGPSTGRVPDRAHRALALVAVCLAITAAPATPAAPAPAAAQTIQLQPLVTGLTSPLGLANAGDGSNRLFIVLRDGRILVWSQGNVIGTFLNVSGLISCCNSEQGLLGLAFHPRYEDNGFFYIHYTDRGGNTVVARYRVSVSNQNVADPGSRVPVMTVPQPQANHNGGHLAFGPDGYLYIGRGDGGGAGDPNNNAQNLGSLLGKMLRIDVDGALPYSVPPDNPFVGRPGIRPEIWDYGLRNPWRYSFDRATGTLFIADVGQGAREEVNVEPPDAGGKNYGWRRMEGSLCFNPSTGCNDGTLTLPQIEYSHSEGCSVTGGYQYRGSAIPGLFARYVYGDFCQGTIWGATEQGGGAWSTAVLLDTALRISSFGEDEQGELYVIHIGTSANNFTDGAVYRIVAPPASGEIVLDNLPVGQQDAARTVTGTWCVSASGGFFGVNSLYSCGGGLDTYRWTPTLTAGVYDVFVWWTQHANRSTSVPISVVHAGGTTTRTFNQQTGGGHWVLHGRYTFNAGTNGSVRVSDVNGQAAADAVRFVPAP